jgi:aromatic ring-opening dioxygenase catalytic subunit (LigB family)
MIGLGLASSHAPAMFCPTDVWPRVYAAIPSYTQESQPHTAKLETPEVIDGYIARINDGFGVLRGHIEEYHPDAIIVMGDHDHMFKAADHHAGCIYTADKVWGPSMPYYMNLPPQDSYIESPVHVELARFLLKGLQERGFDIVDSAEFESHCDDKNYGTSHSITLPLPHLVPKLDIPVIPLFINEYCPPMPNGQWCWDVGMAVADILRTRPERIAIYGSGGMSHDPFGPRAGWVDEPLDNWIFERIESNRGVELARLFGFDSATLRGGTGELRAWIAAAGACQWPGKKIDYIPSNHSKTGLGFSVWPVQTP